MLDALSALGCGIDGDGDSAARHRPRRRGRSTQQATLFLGNAGTAMRPLAAALALGAAAGGALRAPRRAAHARAADRRPGRCAAPARLRDRLPRQPRAFRRCASIRPPAPLDARRADPRARRRLEPVPHRAAARPAAGAPARADASIEVDGELISKPYVEITLNLLARFGVAVARDGWQRFTHSAPAARYRSPGAIHRRGRRVVGVVLRRRSARSPRARRAAAHRRRRQRLDPGRHPLRRRRARDGRARSTAAPNWLEVRARRAGRCAAIDARLQPHPRRRDDAGGDGAVRRRHRRALTQHRQLARQGDRPLAAMATELRKLGADGRRRRRLHRDHAARAPGAPQRSTPTTTTAWRCACRWRRSTRRRGAAVPVRILDPHCVAKTFPDYFETLFVGRPRRRRRRSR